MRLHAARRHKRARFVAFRAWFVARTVSCLALVLLGASSCGDKTTPPTPGSEAPPWASGQGKVPPRPGMVWVPPGVLSAGTPADRVPRVPDAELTGVPFELGGFYIDLYPHPAEPGAIPTTNVTRDEATAICAKDGKRLCSELEIERACKGPENVTYPYGDTYRHDMCGTGKAGDSLTPNGFHTGCTSPFGVHDTHGTVWFWTSSDYARGLEGMVVVKGGNSTHGELVGRCANVRPQKPDLAAPNIGVRCCAGVVNPATVSLDVTRGTPLKYRRDDVVMQQRFAKEISKLPTIAEGKIPPATGPAGEVPKAFHVERIWVWHPLGNEELYVAGGCAQTSRKTCGLFVGREIGESIRLLVFVATERWQPTVGEPDDARLLQVMGGDDYGAFRKTVAWEWGKVTIFPKERKKGRRWVTP